MIDGCPGWLEGTKYHHHRKISPLVIVQRHWRSLHYNLVRIPPICDLHRQSSKEQCYKIRKTGFHGGTSDAKLLSVLSTRSCGIVVAGQTQGCACMYAKIGLLLNKNIQSPTYAHHTLYVTVIIYTKMYVEAGGPKPKTTYYHSSVRKCLIPLPCVHKCPYVR